MLLHENCFIIVCYIRDEFRNQANLTPKEIAYISKWAVFEINVKGIQGTSFMV